MRHKYSKEQIQFLKDIAKGKSYAEIHNLFNAHFDLSLGFWQIIGTLKRYGLFNGRNTQFKTGLIPHNKGVKGFNAGNPTRFKKGNIPKNHRPIGSEKVDIYGILHVKIAEPKTWKAKHVLIWEKVNGKVPKGHLVIFADGNKSNFAIDNLLLVSRSQLMKMNQKGLIYDNSDFTKTGKIIADVYLAIGKKRCIV